MDPRENLRHVREAKNKFNLNPAESLMVFAMNAGCYGDREKLLARLKTDLQAAIAVELATIPIYLYTYYSINRTKTSGQELTDTARFANEAGAVIMSVAVEEMLHMSLSSNIYFALTGAPPLLYMNAPVTYPAMLPHHNPVGPPGPHGGVDTHIPLKGLSFEQLWHFLQIEYPQGPITGVMDTIEPLIPDFDLMKDDAPGLLTEQLGEMLHSMGWPSDGNWNSIGQFYSFIRCMIASELVIENDFLTGVAAQQIQPYNYSPNNVDTIYPSEKFNKKAPAPDPDNPVPPIAGNQNAAQVAVYTNEPDSHSGCQKQDWEEDEELITVFSKEKAMQALLTICEQGEGYKDEIGAEETTTDPVPNPGENPPDTRNYTPEESHFFKFLRLQAQFKDYDEHVEQLPIWMAEEIAAMEIQEILEDQYAKRSAVDLIAGKYVYDYPDSPTSAQYPDAYAAINDFNSGLFQYMLVLSETIYLVKPEMVGPNNNLHSQHQFFNIALHRSMIWVMDKWILMMRELPPVTEGNFKNKALAPTFENLDLGPRENAFEALKVLGDLAVVAATSISAKHGQRAEQLVSKAISLMSPDGMHPMHLPDVKTHWNGNTPIDPSASDSQNATAAE